MTDKSRISRQWNIKYAKKSCSSDAQDHILSPSAGECTGIEPPITKRRKLSSRCPSASSVASSICSQFSSISYLSSQSPPRRSRRSGHSRTKSHHRDRDHHKHSPSRRRHHHHHHQSMQQQQRQPAPLNNNDTIIHIVRGLFAWTVHRYDVFAPIRTEWPATTSLPVLNPFVESKFLPYLLEAISDKHVQMASGLEVYGSNGDIVMDSMTARARRQTKQLLKTEDYAALPPFAQFVLQIMHGLVLKPHQTQSAATSERERQLARVLSEKYDAFPAQHECQSIACRIVFYILKSALQIKQRTDFMMDSEQSSLQACGGSGAHDLQYAKRYSKLVCKLCWKHEQRLPHSLNIPYKKAHFINICDACREWILNCERFWRFNEAMLEWDEGWQFLVDDCKYAQYKSMLGVLCAIVIRHYYLKTL